MSFSSTYGHCLLRTLISSIALTLSFAAHAQNPDSLAARKKGVFNDLLNVIRRDTVQHDFLNQLQRNDQRFTPFNGLIIRKVDIVRIPFGTSFKDTSKKDSSTLTRLGNIVHHITKRQIVQNNLFFSPADTINGFLFADNERYLRQLPYLQDAEIRLTPVEGTDSVDVTVRTKDLFSLGGAIGSLGVNHTDGQIREDNIGGSGSALVFYGLYDKERKKNLAGGIEITRRNIGGSFVDQTIGYQSNYTSILKSPPQENYFYYDVKKPLVNRFNTVVYELNASYHATSNRYNTDSIYKADFRYRFYDFEAWLGYNINGRKFTPYDESRKLRLLSGVRVITRKFTKLPAIFNSKYNWQYADLTGILFSFTFYRQNFVKTRYIYGFGRAEDIPVGLQFTTTLGHTIKNQLSRPYLGFNFETSTFNRKKNYIDFILRTEGYIDGKKLKDVNLLSSVSYFDRLKNIGSKWTQRFFINFSAAGQVDPVLNEPLFLKSDFALPEYGRELVGGNVRISANVESVFFSPWSLAGFRMAPLYFFNMAAFSPYDSHLKLFPSTGPGLRIRNESLIFGTIDLKGFYFPNKNSYGESFGIDISTNVIFRYSNQFIRKPDFIQIN